MSIRGAIGRSSIIELGECRPGKGAALRTQVAIIGAGPAGMLTALVLHGAGIDASVLY